MTRFTAFSGGVTASSLRAVVCTDCFDKLAVACGDACAPCFCTAYDGDAALVISFDAAGGIGNARVAGFGVADEPTADCAICVGAAGDVATACVVGFDTARETGTDSAACFGASTGAGKACAPCLIDASALTGAAATSTVTGLAFSDAISACQAATAGVIDAVFGFSASFIEQVTSSHVSAMVQPAKIAPASR